MEHEVIIYSTPNCPWCARTKQYLKEHNIPFIDYDVSANREKAEEMIQKSGQMGVPVVDIDGVIIVGFDKPRIDLMLDL